MNWQPVNDSHYAGPRLILPGRYAGLFQLSPLEAAAQRSMEESEAGHRPAHYVLDNSNNPGAPTIIIATGPNEDWRPPPDELRAIAEERVVEDARSERALSLADRQKRFREEYIAQIDRRWRALTSKTQFST